MEKAITARTRGQLSLTRFHYSNIYVTIPPLTGIRVAAVGPQLDYFFKVGDRQWYVNLKSYYEFDAKNRPEGWNVWLTLAIPLGSGKK